MAVQFLRHACQALDTDATIARLDIRKALELLVVSQVRTPMNRPTTGLASWQSRAVVDYIFAHLAQPIRIGDLAGVARLSASHFSRAFKLGFRASPHAYIVALRLSHSRILLADCNEQLSQIAVTCGFADQSHFSRVFRRRVGCTPGAWRREHLSDPVENAAVPIGNPAGARALQLDHFERLHFPEGEDASTGTGRTLSSATFASA